MASTTIPAPAAVAPTDSQVMVPTEALADYLATMDIVAYGPFGEGGPVGLPDLDRSTRGKLNRRINAVASGPTARRQRSLYTFATTPVLIGYLQSLRADAIRASGEAVEPWLATLPAGARVLDVGCNVGYLALWYARRFPHLDVTGCDFVPASIEYATGLLAEAGVGNARFVVADLATGLPEGPFDAITSTQSITSAEGDRAAMLGRVAEALRPAGLFVSVDILPTHVATGQFVNEAASVGLGLVGATMAHYGEDGGHGAYPVLTFRKGADPVEVDLVGMYSAALQAIHRRRLQDLGWSDEEISENRAIRSAAGECARCEGCGA